MEEKKHKIHPNSLKNLKSFDKRTPEEMREIARKGGKARWEKYNERKTFQEELLALLMTNNNNKKISIAQIKKARAGDSKAFEVIRDTIGEKPTDKVESSNEVTIKFSDEMRGWGE